MSGQPGRYTRSFGGMVGAMLVVVVLVVVFVVFRDANRDDLAPGARAVDYATDARYARQQAGFELLAPPTLPAGWRATSVRFVPGADERWHLGMLTDEDRYVGLEQADASVAAMVEMHVDPEATRGRAVEVAGDRWQTYRDDAGDLALVRREAATTTLVVGHEVPVEELVAFTASLR